MSSLRARCPNCRTFTAVAVGDGYECHSCGSTFSAGLVRVPRAWGEGGEGMAEAAHIRLPYPEVAIVERDTLEEQSEALAESLAARPIALGGCCCTHVGAAQGVARRVERLAVVWIDAHGDLNTPETSPSGNLWGMPFRMLLDGGVVAAAGRGAHRRSQPRSSRDRVREGDRHRRLAGSRALGCRRHLRRARSRRAGSERGRCSHPGARRAVCVAEIERLLNDLAERTRIAGIGVTGLLPTERNAALAARMLAAAGFR